MCFAVQNQQLIAAVWCTPYFLLLYSLYCISNLFCNILKCSLLCVQFYLLFSKIPPSTIWFVVYDGIPCWNMIGQNEDRLLYIGWFWISRYLDHFIFVGQVLRQYAPPGCSVDIPKLGPSSQFCKSQEYIYPRKLLLHMSLLIVKILFPFCLRVSQLLSFTLLCHYPKTIHLPNVTLCQIIILCEMKESVFLRPVSERFIPFSSKLSTL